MHGAAPGIHPGRTIRASSNSDLQWSIPLNNVDYRFAVAQPASSYFFLK
jgi:hypothetical protein